MLLPFQLWQLLQDSFMGCWISECHPYLSTQIPFSFKFLSIFFQNVLNLSLANCSFYRVRITVLAYSSVFLLPLTLCFPSSQSPSLLPSLLSVTLPFFLSPSLHSSFLLFPLCHSLVHLFADIYIHSVVLDLGEVSEHFLLCFISEAAGTFEVSTKTGEAGGVLVSNPSPPQRQDSSLSCTSFH